MNELGWRKSSHSGTTGDCVEVAMTVEAALVRDSKDPGKRHIGVPLARWRLFLSQVKAGRYAADIGIQTSSW